MKQMFSRFKTVLSGLIVVMLILGTLINGNAQNGSFTSNGPQKFVQGPNVIIVTPILGAGTTCKARKFKACVRSCFNIPVVGTTVHFSVTGANTGTSADVVTDAFGKAVFSYAGPNSGLDLITASASNSLNGYAIFLWKKCTTPVCTPPTDRLYVDASAPAGGNGGTWECAMNDLNTAITTANGNAAIKSIWVAEGTYKPSAPAGRGATFSITRSDLQVLGGFTGVENNASDADPVANLTVISGDIGVAGDPSDNSLHTITIANLPASPNALEINGFTIQNGNANITGSGNNAGGALFANYNDLSTPVSFKRTVFTLNNSTGYGGAIWISHCDVSFDGCTFVANTSDLGGAIYGFFSSPKFTRTVFNQNNAVTGGGAYYGNYGTPSFALTVFASNTSRNGGAVYQNQANAVYANTVLTGNSASFQGGAVYQHNASNSTITNSTFFNNSAVNSAGALALGLNASSSVVNNTIFWKNKKGAADNVANADVHSFGGGSNQYHNNVLQANTSVPADNGTTISSNIRGTDPLFTNEASPIGADLQWGTADDGLQLQDGSPAVNTGDNAAAAPLPTDFNVNPRIVCTIVDRGAYENQNCAPIAVTRRGQAITLVKKEPATRSAGLVANPFNSDLQVSYTGTEKCVITVYGVNGRTMMTGKAIQGITHINTAAWGTGLYQVVLHTASGQKMVFKAAKM